MVTMADYSRWERNKHHCQLQEIPTLKRYPRRANRGKVLELDEMKMKRDQRQFILEFRNSLLHKNMSVAAEIGAKESKQVSDVSHMLSRYGKFKVSLCVLKSHFEQQLQEAMEQVKYLEETTFQEIQDLTRKVERIEQELKTYTDELNVLRKYKEKEFHRKCAKIDELKDQIQDEKERYEFKFTELESMIHAEEVKCEEDMHGKWSEIQEIAAKGCLKTVGKSTLERTLLLKRMTREIKKLKEIKEILQVDVVTLKKNIASLSIKSSSITT